MELHPVKSSNIKAVGYDPDAQRLVVEFHSGKKYAYFEVSPEVHKEFLGSKTMGIFFVREIRGKYPTRRIYEQAEP